MPTYDSFCRAPLADLACVALPDNAVHTDGSLERLIQRALSTVDLAALSPLDAALATKLSGYDDLPPMPNLSAAVAYLPARPRDFIDSVHAGLMIASAARDKAAMVNVLDAMRAFQASMPKIPENVLMPAGADVIRVSSELYRRTGQRFLLTLMERLRAQLPDVSGMFHSFPFLKPFTPEPVADDAMDEASQYFRRMRMLGTGSLTADALAITALMAMYTGSSRDAGAAKAGISALQRYHGMPNGTFSSDPYLAGRDPARDTDLASVCAQLEALHDLLAASGELSFAERMERVVENALSAILQEEGVCAAQAVNAFPGNPEHAVAPAQSAQSTMLLRALYAVRRTIWMLRSEEELVMLLPYEGCCLARMDGTPVRLTAQRTANTLTLSVETRQPAEFSLSLRVPAYARGASVTVNGERPQAAESGKLFTVRRLFKTGDSVTLTLGCKPFLENGFRGSVSVYCGALLMALPVPDDAAAWQYALDEEAAMEAEWENGRPRVRVDACMAEDWRARNGVMLPPPQGCAMGEAYELTLLPYADTQGRVAAFPLATHRG